MVVNQCPGIVVDSWGSPNLPGVEAAVALLLLGLGRLLISHRLHRLLGRVIGLGRVRGLRRVETVGLGRVALALGSTTVGEEEEAVSQSVPS